ncbi:MAG: multiheme c-type cytochrome, partial [bacterium]
MTGAAALGLWAVALVLPAAYPVPARGAEAASAAPLSETTQACLECHRTVTPGIVADWERGRHRRVTPAAALVLPEATRRLSSPDVPERLRPTAVGCFECHGLNPERHADRFDHFGFTISIVVSPDDCRTCHRTEAEQYAESKKAHALDNLRENPTYHGLVDTLTATHRVEGRTVTRIASGPSAQATSCFACHGTEVKVRGMRTVDSALGSIEVPDLEGWP